MLHRIAASCSFANRRDCEPCTQTLALQAAATLALYPKATRARECLLERLVPTPRRHAIVRSAAADCSDGAGLLVWCVLHCTWSPCIPRHHIPSPFALVQHVTRRGL